MGVERISWALGGQRITVSLPPQEGAWAEEGLRGVLHVPATFQGRGPQPRPLPEVTEDMTALGALGRSI